MEKRYLAPSEVAKAIIYSAETKGDLSITRMLILGIMAGILIGFGSFANIVITQTLGNIDLGLSKFIGASVFPVGLILVILSGSELFTGNNLMTIALVDGKITFTKMIRNWFFVYLGNFIGSLLLAYIVYNSGLVNDNVLSNAQKIGLTKISLTFQVAFVRGFLCNMLVVLAVWSATAAMDIGSKILSLWFPIMIFVLSGFEHSIANMFFLPLAIFSGLPTTWNNIWIKNLIPVTLGNIASGGILVPLVYYITYILPAKKKYD
ncbi:MAG: formate/nitrite transporter family protein [Tissierellales bacterium]